MGLSFEQPVETLGIILTACRIAAGSKETLKLGNIAISRDWGWAPEYVDAMWRMLQLEVPDDFVIATGDLRKLADFIDLAFSSLQLVWREYVETDPSLFRPSDIFMGFGDPVKAYKILGWQARHRLEDIVRMMVDAEKTHHLQ